MSQAASAHGVIDPKTGLLGTGVPTGKLGTWIFLASEVMFFAGLIGSYIVLRMGSESWPEPGTVLSTGLLAFNTFVLITSSVTMVMALHSIRCGNVQSLRLYLLLTMVLGLTFLGIKIYDYVHLIHNGIAPNTGLFGSCFFTLTGFHGLHVLGGVVTLAVMYVLAGRGEFSPDHHGYIECTGLYWHFVDLVWIILFVILCLI